MVPPIAHAGATTGTALGSGRMVDLSMNTQGTNYGMPTPDMPPIYMPTRYTGTVSSDSSASETHVSGAAATTHVLGEETGGTQMTGTENLVALSDRRDLLLYPSANFKTTKSTPYPTSKKLFWDGRKGTSWRVFISNIHACALQTQMGYMFGTEDIQDHLRGGFNGIESHLRMTIHPYQFNNDLGHLYSAIKQATFHAANIHDVLKQFEKHRFTPADSSPPDGLGL
jgi:hypothetical protein